MQHAAPTTRAASLYFSLVGLQFLLAFTMPGVTQHGLPVSSLGGRTLPYLCNAYTSMYMTLLIVGGAHYLGLFNIADVIDLYGPLYTIANLTGFGFALGWYLVGEGYRMSGNVVYDYFMGSTLNPRIGVIDIKM